MKTRFRHIAMAMGAVLALAAPMAQAATDPYRPGKLDKLKEDSPGAIYGGSLYVVDHTQTVDFTFLFDDDLFHEEKVVYWRDGVDGEWQVLFSEGQWKYAKKNPGSSNLVTIPLTATSDQVFFAVAIENHDLGTKNDGTFLFSTGNGSYDEKPATSTIAVGAGHPHSVMFYDYNGTDNLALIGFEDSPKFVLDDWDDFIFTVSNVSPLSVPEPGTYAMLLAGLGIVGFVAKRRRRMI